jgi:hypothetical protein
MRCLALALLVGDEYKAGDTDTVLLLKERGGGEEIMMGGAA